MLTFFKDKKFAWASIFSPPVIAILLSHSVFSALIDSVKTGDFLASSTSSATSATGTSHLLYNSSTGSLYYDADGAGGANAVHFAVVNQYGQLNSHPILTAADFLIK